MQSVIIDSPLGPLQLVGDDNSVTAIEFPGRHQPLPAGGNSPVLTRCVAQLQEYFAGSRRHFELPLAAEGTVFQRSVWQALTEIPYGEVRSYRDIADAIGRPKAVRAVGAANGRNPLPIVVPCHRVIGADGSLTGFAGGIEAKRLLLQLEGAL